MAKINKFLKDYLDVLKDDEGVNNPVCIDNTAQQFYWTPQGVEPVKIIQEEMRPPWEINPEKNMPELGGTMPSANSVKKDTNSAYILNALKDKAKDCPQDVSFKWLLSKNIKIDIDDLARLIGLMSPEVSATKHLISYVIMCLDKPLKFDEVGKIAKALRGYPSSKSLAINFIRYVLSQINSEQYIMQLTTSSEKDVSNFNSALESCLLLSLNDYASSLATDSIDNLCKNWYKVEECMEISNSIIDLFTDYILKINTTNIPRLSEGYLKFIYYIVMRTILAEIVKVYLNRKAQLYCGRINSQRLQLLSYIIRIMEKAYSLHSIFTKGDTWTTAGSDYYAETFTITSIDVTRFLDFCECAKNENFPLQLMKSVYTSIAEIVINNDDSFIDRKLPSEINFIDRIFKYCKDDLELQKLFYSKVTDQIMSKVSNEGISNNNIKSLNSIYLFTYKQITHPDKIAADILKMFIDKIIAVLSYSKIRMLGRSSLTFGNKIQTIYKYALENCIYNNIILVQNKQKVFENITEIFLKENIWTSRTITELCDKFESDELKLVFILSSLYKSNLQLFELIVKKYMDNKGIVAKLYEKCKGFKICALTNFIRGFKERITLDVLREAVKQEITPNDIFHLASIFPNEMDTCIKQLTLDLEV